MRTSTPLRTIAAEDTMQDAASTLAFFAVGALPVVEHGRLIGIISEQDVVRAVAEECDLAATPVEDYFTREPAWIETDEDMERARVLMAGRRIRHLPVVEDGTVVGMLSVRDLLEATTVAEAISGTEAPSRGTTRR